MQPGTETSTGRDRTRASETRADPTRRRLASPRSLQAGSPTGADTALRPSNPGSPHHSRCRSRSGPLGPSPTLPSARARGGVHRGQVPRRLWMRWTRIHRSDRSPFVEIASALSGVDDRVAPRLFRAIRVEQRATGTPGGTWNSPSWSSSVSRRPAGLAGERRGTTIAPRSRGADHAGDHHAARRGGRVQVLVGRVLDLPCDKVAQAGGPSAWCLRLDGPGR
jgi:hypothetical protein